MINGAIDREAGNVLRNFSRLRDVEVLFKTRDRLPGGSIMMAQPVFADLWRSPEKRRYRVLIRRAFTLGGEVFTPSALPREVMQGWFAHELGHIVDYRDRSGRGLLRFGWQYVFSTQFRKQAERRADAFAVEAGFGKALVATKNFILNHTGLPEAYKRTIRTYYPSPDEILEMEEAFRKGAV